MAHVGDMDLKREIAVLEFLDPHGVVEIASGFAVDGDDIEAAEILTPRDFLRRNRSRYRASLRNRLIRKTVRNMMRADQDFDVQAEVAGTAEDLDNAAGGALAMFAEIENFGGHDHAVQ